jgi:hypothetical protein
MLEIVVRMLLVALKQSNMLEIMEKESKKTKNVADDVVVGLLKLLIFLADAGIIPLPPESDIERKVPYFAPGRSVPGPPQP